MTKCILLWTLVAALVLSASAFAPQPKNALALTSTSSLGAIGGKKKPKEDLSYIESRDMTREEMAALNAKNEEIMNMELSAMTAFSLVISLPILYLCWVAFFSD